MRKVLGPVLALLGALLVAVAILAQVYAKDQLMKTPIDSDSTTYVSGTAQLSDGTELSTFDVLAWDVTKGDTEKSDSEVAVFANSSCLVKNEGGIDGCVSSGEPGNRLLSASTDNFATDRVTALAVNDPQYLPADAVAHEGLINKWPFHAEEKTYPYWDDVVGGAVDAVYDGRETLDGLETMVFKVTVTGAPIEISAGVPGTYDDEKSIYIDPYTGKIIHQIDHQVRSDAEGNPVLVLDLAFTDQQIQDNVDEANDATSKLKLITRTVPIIGYVVGIPMLLLGLFLSIRAYRREDQDESTTDSTTSG
jgi:hypothetical protein